MTSFYVSDAKITCACSHILLFGVMPRLSKQTQYLQHGRMHFTYNIYCYFLTRNLKIQLSIQQLLQVFAGYRKKYESKNVSRVVVLHVDASNLQEQKYCITPSYFISQVKRNLICKMLSALFLVNLLRIITALSGFLMF